MAGKRKERQGMILYFDHLQEACDTLTAEECGRLMRALFVYAHSGEEPESMPGGLGIFYRLMKRAIDRDGVRYEQTCERNRERARRRRQAEKEEDACSPEQEAPESMEDGEEAEDTEGGCAGGEAPQEDEDGLREESEVREAREECEARAPAANRTEHNGTKPNGTKHNGTKRNGTPAAYGAGGTTRGGVSAYGGGLPWL